MPTDDFGDGVESFDVARQQELMVEVAENAVQRAPDNWVSIDLTYILVGRSMEFEVAVNTTDGPYMQLGRIGFPDAVQQLRDLMYVPGQGTWFTMQLLINSAGEVSTVFGYERPEDEGLLGFDLEQDLQMYPRDVVPQWMLDEIAETRRLVDENGQFVGIRPTDLDDSDDADLGEMDGVLELEDLAVDRERAVLLAADFTPMEPDMWYIKVVRESGSATEPLTTFSEVRSDGRERRKVNVFQDGSTGFASISAYTDGTELDRTPILSADEISLRPGHEATKISPADFQVEWLVSGGW
ncbi:DUF6881 domain-containing protein [Nocardia sp. NPDC052566]|uniref:DUF6881 domain-containing protein n=1 Tax=Nocardia sp. NPDC052566 TaxID=3364330 RepID=UPI0037C7D496